MSTGRYGRKKRLMGEINVVPYIDVMLVLLIIFMVTAPLLTTGVTVDLPNADAKPQEDQDEEPFVVTVDSEGRYFLNESEEAVEAKEIEIRARAVLQVNKELPFMVRGDANARYEYVVQAMVLLQGAGVESVGLVTDPPDS